MPITEGQIRNAALRALAATPTGFLTTEQLISTLEMHFLPTGTDAEILNGRSDTHFSQKVRNLVSHREQSTSLEARGLATYDAIREGWQITVVGRQNITAQTP